MTSVRSRKRWANSSRIRDSRSLDVIAGDARARLPGLQVGPDRSGTRLAREMGMDAIPDMLQRLGSITFPGIALLAACASAGDRSVAAERAALVEVLRSEGIRDEAVLAAIASVPRHEFVPPAERHLAYANRALPIGGGQTISQPFVVAAMTEALALRADERVLEVGTGSGYQAAVLSRLAAEVWSIEIDPELSERAARLLERLGYANVRTRAGDGFYGWQEEAPFDAVVVTAATPRMPERLVAQLAEGGRIIAPVGDDRLQTLVLGRKVGGELVETRLLPVMFVPMTGAVRAPTP